VGLLIMVESLGIPLPGEIALVTATVLATQHTLAVSPAWIAAAASAGAIAGDSIGFYLGHRFGRKLFDWLGRKFPRHFGPGNVALARDHLHDLVPRRGRREMAIPVVLDRADRGGRGRPDGHAADPAEGRDADQ
jgi:hypothetical protein